jgi:hypothetical protein
VQEVGGAVAAVRRTKTTLDAVVCFSTPKELQSAYSPEAGSSKSPRSVVRMWWSALLWQAR